MIPIERPCSREGKDTSRRSCTTSQRHPIKYIRKEDRGKKKKFKKKKSVSIRTSLSSQLPAYMYLDGPAHVEAIPHLDRRILWRPVPDRNDRWAHLHVLYRFQKGVEGKGGDGAFRDVVGLVAVVGSVVGTKTPDEKEGVTDVLVGGSVGVVDVRVKDLGDGVHKIHAILG